MATRKRVDSWVVTDDFWERVEPLISVRARIKGKEYMRKPGAGWPPKPARQVFEPVVYVLRTGCQWKALPKAIFVVGVVFSVFYPSEFLETRVSRVPNMPVVVTILVNWKGSDDTIECLESLFVSDYPNQRVVVVDNGSKDGSLAKLAAWAEGKIVARPKRESGNDSLSTACVKPVRYVTLSLEDTVNGRGWDSGADMVLIDGRRNHGFAGGVNIGLRFALANNSVQYAWVLNNDTVVARDCLSRMERRLSQGGGVGMCGSRVLFYWHPDVVQVLGGAQFRRWTGTSRLLGSRAPASKAVDAKEIERRLDHLTGASMLVSRSFLEQVGLMDESYFLYYEETDWAMRGKDRYRLMYADDAVVYHKEGASIGSSHQRAKRSPLSSFFLVRSRLRFTRKFFPWALPSVLAYSVLVALRALFEGHREQASAMFSALRGLSAQEALGWTPD